MPVIDGITSQTIYDCKLMDGIGSDNATGVAMNKLGGRTFNYNIANCLSTLVCAS